MNYEIINKEKPKLRVCLSCDNCFLSKHKFNRICKECKSDLEYTEENEEPQMEE